MADPVTPAAPSWLEISADALTHNVRFLRSRLADGARLGVVVKSNAYGHGDVLAGRVFLEAGVDWLIVNGAAEAVALRRGGLPDDAPIYVCGPVYPAEADALATVGARVAVYAREMVDALAASGRATARDVPLHVKLETGTHRQGLGERDALALAHHIRATDGVTLEGFTTHYADIEDTIDHRFARGQLARFREVVAAARAAGLDAPIAHTANSAATILYPETHGDLVRVGIAAYGLWPSTETWATLLEQGAQTGRRGATTGMRAELHPAMRWRARIAQVKDVPKGGFVGYGRTFRATHAMRVAVLPVGYHEGYDRRLSNLAHVLVQGVRAPVCGRVCMNMTMVDVSDVPGVRAGDVATLLGPDGGERLTAGELAGWMGTIHYEVVSRLHPALPRVRV